MIDHVGLKVGDYQKSLAFYTKALEPLGYRPEYTDTTTKTAGFGAKGAPDFWISEGTPMACVHIALRSPDRATVNTFHAAALSAGGKDNGGPGPRPDYGPTYYAAFVLDLDGNNIELVCHEPA